MFRILLLSLPHYACMHLNRFCDAYAALNSCLLLSVMLCDLRCSETGAAFFNDMFSKHAMHSGGAEEVLFAGAWVGCELDLCTLLLQLLLGPGAPCGREHALANATAAWFLLLQQPQFSTSQCLPRATS